MAKIPLNRLVKGVKPGKSFNVDKKIAEARKSMNDFTPKDEEYQKGAADFINFKNIKRNKPSKIFKNPSKSASGSASSLSEPRTGAVEQASPNSSASAASTDQSNKRSLKKVPEGFKEKRAELTYDQQLSDAKNKINSSKSEKYHIGRVEENRKNAINDISNIDENDVDKMKQYAESKGYTVSGSMTKDKLLKAVDSHAKERLRAGADWTDTMMAHHVPQYAVALGTTATLAANVLSSNGHKSNAELYSSPY